MNIICENERYFHIQALNPFLPEVPLAKGFSFHVGSTKNRYYDVRSGSTRNNYFVTMSVIENQRTLKNEEYIPLLRNCTQFLKELIFEEVRQQQFPQLPSRLRCLYVIQPIKENINYWWNIFSNDQKQILELELSGNILFPNTKYLECNPYISLMRMRANKYWLGKPISEVKPDDECLFEGFVSIKNCFQSPSEIPNDHLKGLNS